MMREGRREAGHGEGRLLKRNGIGIGTVKIHPTTVIGHPSGNGHGASGRHALHV